MARNSRNTTKAPPPPSVQESVSSPATITRQKALIFISHDSRDAEIAQAFGDLLSDVSVGTLKTFRSSDNLGTTGIPFGDEWYNAIINKLTDATDVVALLTATSVDRPWILYEAGMAAGKLSTRVIGVAVGLPLSKAITGPFSQFQNSADDEQSLTKLMLQLLQRNPDAAPRPETVAGHVQAFRQKISTILKSKGAEGDLSAPSEEENVAILVEEIKGMLRELPDRLRDRETSPRGGRNRTRLNMRALDEMAFRGDRFGFATGFLAIVSVLKDDIPWIYEPCMEFYRLVASTRSETKIRAATLHLHEFVAFASRGPFRGLLDEEMAHFAVRALHNAIEQMVGNRPIRRRLSDEEKVQIENDE